MQEKIKTRIAFIMVLFITVLFIPNVSHAATYDDADTITYETDAGEEVTFKRADFDDACDDLTGETLDYVKFSLPSSDAGTLYYDYDDGDFDSKVKTTTKYYYDSSQSLSKVTFVPDEDFEGTVTIWYTGYDEEGDSYDGKVKIIVDDEENDDTAEDLTYTMDGEKELEFDEDDFNDVCEDLNDEELDYVKFTLPSSSAGTLYYSYSSDDNYDSKVTASTKYYYDGSPNLSRVSFVPRSSYSGTVTIKYTGYDEDDNSYTGKVRISVEDTAASEIAYTIDDDETVTLDEDDFYDLCEELNDEALDYITFTLPSDAKGVLYYDYDDDDGEYGSKVTASKKYYYDSSPYLSRITFKPAKNFSGICIINFKGYDTDGVSFSGTVEITVTGNLPAANTITYSATPGSPVFFKEDDFNNVCKKLKDNNLVYVKFKLPSGSIGKLYYGYTSDGKYTSEVSDTSKYYYGATPFLLNVVYVPAGSVAGITTIDYTGYDTEGFAFSGKVQITTNGAAVNPAIKKSKYYGDVDEAYSWAVDYIDTLSQNGIITGSTGMDGKKHFYPAAKIKRGEFMLLLYKALNLPAGTGTGNFADVAKGEYYYDAIAAAKALGIAQGSDNKFYPNASITREDTMVLALRAMNKSGAGVAAADVSMLSGYSDRYVISDYAKESVAALIKAGIITGGDDNKIRPMESITRAEAAAIIYRIKY
ncbi:MAG: S-layer homology domain-containing protein [Eubacteriales bacterium]|nr:S-layer homology domain-containing protein [Eubacteriales bacterium]